MLHPETVQLIAEVCGFFDTHDFSAGSRHADLARKDPEACVVSLLQNIKEDLPVISAILYHTVQRAAYEGDLKEARRILGPLAKTPLEKAPREKPRKGHAKGELVNC